MTTTEFKGLPAICGGKPLLYAKDLQTCVETNGLRSPYCTVHAIANRSKLRVLVYRDFQAGCSLGGSTGFFTTSLHNLPHRKRVRDDETNLLVSVLRLSGITRVVKGCLRVRNLIYAQVFDREWLTANMPDAELRRQRAAYRRGLLRATAVAALILIFLSSLLIYAIRQRNRAEEQERAKRRLLYAAHMNMAHQAWESADLGRVEELLEAYRPRLGEEDLRGIE